MGVVNWMSLFTFGEGGLSGFVVVVVVGGGMVEKKINGGDKGAGGRFCWGG